MNIKHLETLDNDNLFKAILTLKNVEECYMFFCDLFTPNELNSISQRVQIAIELRKGDTFTNVCKNVKASSATISRVKNQLIYGNDGLNLALGRLEHEEQ